MNLIQIASGHWINMNQVTSVYDDGFQLIFYFDYWNIEENCQGYIRTSIEFYVSVKTQLKI